MVHIDAAQVRRSLAMAIIGAGGLQAWGATGGPPADAPLPRDETPCVTLRQIELRGDEAGRFGWLLDRLAGPDGTDGPLRRCLGAVGIDQLVRRAQQALIDRGLVTSRVLLAPQDLRQGHLRLTLVPGRLRHARFTDETSRHPPARQTLPMEGGDLLDLRDIEQALENLQRLPSVRAAIRIEPGDAPGESDLRIDWAQDRPVRLRLSLDDSGTRDTDRYRIGAALDIDNPLALSDRLGLSLQDGVGRRSPQPQAAQGWGWHYSLPWGRAQLALDARRHENRQIVAGAFQNYTYRGTSASQEATLTWMLHRDARRKTTVHARAFAWQSRNHIDDTEVTVQRRAVGGWQLGAGHRAFIGDGTLELGLQLQRGTGAFGALPAPEDAFGEGTSRFVLWQAHAEWDQPLKVGGMALSYRGRWRAQIHRTPVSPPERFAIGGRSTVRGFDGTYSLSAESGWYWRNDLAAPLGSSGLQLFAGLDVGRVRGPSTALLTGSRLAGAVVGLRGSPGAGSALSGELFAGWPLKKPDGFPTAPLSVGFSLNADF